MKYVEQWEERIRQEVVAREQLTKIYERSLNTGAEKLNNETMNMAGVNVMSTMYVCTIKTSDGLTASLASGTAITVNAAAYVIRDVVLLEDGSFTQLAMSR